MSALGRSCDLKQPPNHGLYICLPCPPTAPQTLGATATVNQAVGQWAAGPGQCAGPDLL